MLKVNNFYVIFSPFIIENILCPEFLSKLSWDIFFFLQLNVKTKGQCAKPVVMICGPTETCLDVIQGIDGHGWLKWRPLSFFLNQWFYRIVWSLWCTPIIYLIFTTTVCNYHFLVFFVNKYKKFTYFIEIHDKYIKYVIWSLNRG